MDAFFSIRLVALLLSQTNIQMEGIVEDEKLKFTAGENVERSLHILLVSNRQQYLEELQRSLFDTKQNSEKRSYNLKVHTCKNIADVINTKLEGIIIDFIAFLINMEDYSCLDQVEQNLKLLDVTFGRQKICLVNPDPKYGEHAVHPLTLQSFAKEYQLNSLNGTIMDSKSITNLSKRILNLAERCCGLFNGIPLVGII